MPGNISRRLVVTGHDEQGRSRVMSDGLITGNGPPSDVGAQFNPVWGSDGVMRYPDKGEKPAFESFFPPVGGCRMLEFYVPPGVTKYPEKTDQAPARPPRFGETRDPDRPGMHRSATMDMGLILEGRIVLELDEGEVTLGAGDVIVQSGTMHRWFNPFDEPARIMGFMVGTEMEPFETK